MFAILISRALDMTPIQFDFIAELLARNRMEMVRLWVERGQAIGLGQINKLWENVVEEALWPSNRRSWGARTRAPRPSGTCTTIPGSTTSASSRRNPSGRAALQRMQVPDPVSPARQSRAPRGHKGRRETNGPCSSQVSRRAGAVLYRNAQRAPARRINLARELSSTCENRSHTDRQA